MSFAWNCKNLYYCTLCVLICSFYLHKKKCPSNVALQGVGEVY